MPLSQSIDSPPLVDSTSTVNENGPLSRGIFEPPNSFVAAAIARNRLIICLFAVALSLIGVGLGLLRQTTYTASATLQVGQVNPNSPGFLGYVQSATSLAAAFSRSIAAEPVLATIQHKLKLAPAAATSRLSTEPIPLSPVFDVIATGPTRAASMQLANVAARAVIAYEGKSNSANPEARSLLHDYREASLALRRAEVNLTTEAQSSSSPDAVLRAEAEKSAAQVRLLAIGKAYIGAVTSQAPRSGLVSLLAGATSASSDRNSKVELFGFMGFIAGIVIGCSVAVLRERRRNFQPSGAGMDAGTPSSQPV